MSKRKSTALRKLAFRIAERIVGEVEWRDKMDVDDVFQLIYQELPFDIEEAEQQEQELRDQLANLDNTPMPRCSESPFAKLRAAVHATPEMSITTVIDAAVKRIQDCDDARSAACYCFASAREDGVPMAYEYQRWPWLAGWTCGCGTVNGVNLPTCRVCGRKEGET